MKWSGALKGVSDQPSLDQLLAQSDAATQAELRTVRIAFSYELLRQLVFGSVMTWPFLIVLIPVGTVIGLGKHLHKRLKEPTLDRIEDAATLVITEDEMPLAA
jgi:hypothetical protein